MRTSSNLRTCVAAVFCFVLWGSELRGAAIVPLPPHSTVEGRPMDQWSASWWDWALRQSRPNDAFSDTTGVRAGVNQSGPVFFLAPTNGATVTRTFTVPAGRYLHIPVMPLLSSDLGGNGGNEAELRQYAQQENADVTLFASINGQAVPDLISYRVTPPPGMTYEFDAVPNNAAFVTPGHHNLAVFDDWALMLAPLPPGTHTIRYGGADPSMNYTTDVTAVITVVPEPAAAGLFVAGGAILLLRTPRTRRRPGSGPFALGPASASAASALRRFPAGRKPPTRDPFPPNPTTHFTQLILPTPTSQLA